MNSENMWTPGDAHRLDALTLSRKEGWAAFAEAEARVQPELLSRGRAPARLGQDCLPWRSA
ncbi:hypothetical protein QMZ92_22735 [Streptomyces sp. HNM0645]|uniref:hypothetical protein n=1 Tax=Streptomyces sp. HNM0645 TaxID=2782343 RepID=UPI0024B71421|nr:hypothetical protein [Streptomyces sp. HNM0645]MDI9887108.1 hypothetical protein [Streptomyces sp. HNM0645]